MMLVFYWFIDDAGFLFYSWFSIGLFLSWIRFQSFGSLCIVVESNFDTGFHVLDNF